jgi:hypothetical protein
LGVLVWPRRQTSEFMKDIDGSIWKTNIWERRKRLSV